MTNIFLQKYNLITHQTGRVNPNVKTLIKKSPEILKELIEKTFFLIGNNVSLKERILVLHTKLKEQPLCKQCDVPVRLNPNTNTFNAFCSTKCSANNQNNKQNKKDTNYKRYGGPAPLCSTTIQEKTILTNQKRYGVKWVGQNKEIREKQKQTNLKRYGNEYANFCKIKETNQKRYGVDFPFQSPLIQEKCYKTYLILYGNHHARKHMTDILHLLESYQWLFNEYVCKKKQWLRLVIV
ncbi:MAG: DUF7487 domain-containing protein [Nitrosopumilaceae archaeon]